MVNISGLDKGRVLQALHQNSKAQGLSFLHERDVSLLECQELIARGLFYYDYFAGRVLKVNLEGDSFDSWEYDRDNGEGAAQRVVDKLKSEQTTSVN